MQKTFSQFNFISFYRQASCPGETLPISAARMLRWDAWFNPEADDMWFKTTFVNENEGIPAI